MDCNATERGALVQGQLRVEHGGSPENTREAPKGQVSHSPMGMVGSTVPAKPCADKSGIKCGPVGLSIFTT